MPADAIKPDTEPNLEKWMELNRQYSETWPNITAKKPALPDADNLKDEAANLRNIFRRTPVLVINYCARSGH